MIHVWVFKKGKQSGCCTVGVARWSTNMNVSSYDEKYNLDEKTINHKLKKTRQLLNKKEPTYLINTLTELKTLYRSVIFKKLKR